MSIEKKFTYNRSEEVRRATEFSRRLLDKPTCLAPTKDNMRLRIAELERENAALREELAKSERRWLSLAQGVKQL